ncbi:MAG: phage virion morphogenesis protein [Comamonas sp.]
MITISTEDKAFRSSLNQLYRRMGNLRPVMESIGMELESRVSERFESRTDPSGSAWAPWAQSTVDGYPDDGNRRLLDRYGDMLASLNHQANTTSVRVGFGQSHATFHEWGTEHMPQRGLLFDNPDAGTLAADDEAAVLDILGVWLDDLAA